MRLLEKSSQLVREYRTGVRVCGKSVDPKFLSSDGISRTQSDCRRVCVHPELIASVNTSAFDGTNPTGESITSGSLVIRQNRYCRAESGLLVTVDSPPITSSIRKSTSLKYPKMLVKPRKISSVDGL